MLLMKETSGRLVQTSDAPTRVARASASRPMNSHVSSVRWGGREGRPIRREAEPATVSTRPAAEDSIVPRRRVGRGGTLGKIAGCKRRGNGQQHPRTHYADRATVVAPTLLGIVKL